MRGPALTQCLLVFVIGLCVGDQHLDDGSETENGVDLGWLPVVSQLKHTSNDDKEDDEALNSREYCKLPPRKGPCPFKLQRFYYDHKARRCKPFIYGGCFGNNNNFKSVHSCTKHCHGVKVYDPMRPKWCLVPAAKGPCNAGMIRYYYDTKTGTCREFLYGGCVGNANNFKTMLECQIHCKAI